ncbi:MAG: CHAT domain-containing tetratricopeptide repeat protein [Fimbriimonas sp.]
MSLLSCFIAVSSFGQAVPGAPKATAPVRALIDQAVSDKTPVAEKRAILLQGLKVAQAAKDACGEALANFWLGYDRYVLGENEKALEYYRRSLSLARKVKDPNGEGAALNNIALVYTKSDGPKALDYYQQSLLLARQTGDTTAEATILVNMAFVYWQLRDRRMTIQHYEQALALKAKNKDLGGQATSLNNLGRVYLALGENQRALECFEKALPLAREVRSAADERLTLNNMAGALLNAGNRQKALEIFENLLVADREAGNEAGEALSLINASMAYFYLGDRHKALDYLDKALPLCKKLKDVDGEATTLNNLGLVYSGLGENRIALDCLMLALPLRRKQRDVAGEASALTNIGHIYSLTGEKRKALEYFERSLPLQRKSLNAPGEARALNQIGVIHSDFGLTQKALTYYEQALSVSRKVGSRDVEAMSLNNMGLLYSGRGDTHKALECLEQALRLRRQIDDPAGEAATLDNIGLVYSRLGEKQKAVDYLTQALELSQRVGDIAGEATVLSNLGIAAYEQGERRQAMEFFERSLSLHKKAGDLGGEVSALRNMGELYARLGDKNTALQLLEQALATSKKLGLTPEETTILTSIGLLYFDSEDNDKALSRFERALKLSREGGFALNEATVLNNLGSFYARTGDVKKAVEHFELALALGRKIGVQEVEASTLNNVAHLYADLGDKWKALRTYDQALAIVVRLGDKGGEATTLHNIAEMYAFDGRNDAAICLLKKSVDLVQSIRGDVRLLGNGLERSYLKGRELTYRALIHLLLREGRIAESEQVREMLKIEEATQFLGPQRTHDAVIRETFKLPREKEILAKYRENADHIGTLYAEKGTLERKSSRTPEETRRFEELDSIIRNAQLVYEKARDVLLTELEKEEKAGADENGKRGLAATTSLRLSSLDSLPAKLAALPSEAGRTAVVHATFFKTTLHFVVYTADGRFSTSQDVGPEALKEVGAPNFADLIVQWRDRIRKKDAKDAQVWAGKVYDAAFKDLVAQLRQAKIQTILWSLDRNLRYIPVSALVANGRALQEEFAMGLVTGLGLPDLGNRGERSAVAFASTAGQPPLPYAEQEAQSVVDTYAPGKAKALVGPDFTKSAFQEACREGTYAGFHLATHFKLRPNGDSILTLGDGSDILLADLLLSNGRTFANVDLLVLSACETGLGFSGGDEGNEIESFAAVATQHGAKAVVATLWKVDDEGSKIFMEHFYRRMKDHPGEGKGESLRRTQLAFADGTVKHPSLDLKQPYYWAPFVLVGNWR